MSEEPRIGDADLMGITHDQAGARALRKSLQRLADSQSGALQEMAREVLSGRIGLREALRVGAYSDALGERIAQGRQEYARLSPEERRQQQAEAQRYLDAQREEIKQENEAASGSVRRPRHSGHGWKL
jgi:hypothetical protein